MDVVCPKCNYVYLDTPDEYSGQELECPACNTQFVCQAAQKCSKCGSLAAAQAEKCSACGQELKNELPKPKIVPQINTQNVQPKPKIVPQINAQNVQPKPQIVPQINTQNVQPKPQIVPQINTQNVQPKPQIVPQVNAQNVQQAIQMSSATMQPQFAPPSSFPGSFSNEEIDSTSYEPESYYDDVNMFTPLARIFFFFGRSRRKECLYLLMWTLLPGIIACLAIIMEIGGFIAGALILFLVGVIVSVLSSENISISNKIIILSTIIFFLIVYIFPPALVILAIPIALIVTVAYLPLSVRRLNDIGLAWWCLPVMFIPVLWLGFVLCPSEPGMNKHGQNPVGQDAFHKGPYYKTLLLNLLIYNIVSLVIHTIAAIAALLIYRGH